MSAIKKEFLERDTRSGIDPERLERLNINYDKSLIRVQYGVEEVEETNITSFINISRTGLKLAISSLEKTPEIGQRVTFDLISANEEFNIRARIAWLEKIANDNWWLGLDITPTSYVRAMYEFLSGEPFDKI